MTGHVRQLISSGYVTTLQDAGFKLGAALMGKTVGAIPA